MISFLVCLAALVVGYFVYGKIVETIFGIEPDRKTPAYTMQDGVDFVPIKPWRIFLIQVLNIAGLGPIYGAIMGALFGTASFLWIVFGCIFAGAVHDFFSGMMSVRHDGKSISEITGIYLGNGMRQVMRVFSVILLLLVGTVFMAGPAGLLANLGMTGIFANKWFWLTIILVYYFVATILPIDKIIARIYPVFGVVLLVMALGVGIMLVFGEHSIPEISLTNMHPKGLSFFPMLFITIACGAISGFHATQSPIMARCLPNEKMGRPIFYGAMIAEGVIALVWAAASVTFFGGIDGLAGVIGQGGAGLVVKEISVGLLGTVGGMLAMLGVVACPISSGDTAFRSARLTIADSMNMKQDGIKNRLIIAVPLLTLGFVLNFIDFSIIWRYFAWSNQTLATIVLWASAVYLFRSKKLHWIATIPATFMSAVVTTYILQAPEGFQLPATISQPIGIVVAVILLGVFIVKTQKIKTAGDPEPA
ncbi:carbon starvation protein A [Oceanispirochaeta crateris]|uniref:Carbon starvation protein A n=1 Tax=Oceanispirochaeta crateris TaxID=2518645 RepID=A0A5C1QMZ5_9SPIO|nr:carbon starvation protein A [Oceanispirochaeta crateris]QEN08708.1 carbon starvation protein A [Oceanispirochaeta crateris]